MFFVFSAFQTELTARPPFLSVSVAWLTFAFTFCLTQAAPTALNSRPTVAALSAATVAASATAVLSSSGVAHAAYALVPIMVATHSMVPTHVTVASLATAAMVAVHITSLLAEIQWTPNAQHVKQVRLQLVYFSDYLTSLPLLSSPAVIFFF